MSLACGGVRDNDIELQPGELVRDLGVVLGASLGPDIAAQWSASDFRVRPDRSWRLIRYHR